MNDSQCVAFLQWALPQLGLRWPGYRKVRRRVCKRVAARIKSLGLANIGAYRAQLECDPTEWRQLAALCPVTISRFFRDRLVFEVLAREIVPQLARAAVARGGREMAAWSAGCACGEEAYSLRLMWDLALQDHFPKLRMHVVATDIDGPVLARARSGCYGRSSLKELPAAWIAQAFTLQNGRYCLRETHRHDIVFERHDLRTAPPAGNFDLILCRNAAFTYFDLAHQQAALRQLVMRLMPGGALLIGVHEKLPPDSAPLESWPACAGLHRKRA